MNRIAAWGLALSVALMGPVPALVSQTEPLLKASSFNLFSKQQDIELGRRNAAQVKKQYPLLPDSSPVTQYVQQLGRRLVAVMPRPTYPYNFHVVRERDINAFALPGGPIFVNLGTIRAADNEAQLAGVIAHEMSHVYLRHSTNMATKQLPVALVGSILGGGVIGKLAQLGASAFFLKYSRDDEAQADANGARIMYNAGYNPVAMANFFQKLERRGGSSAPQFLSDHPSPGNRVAAVRKSVARFPRKNFRQDSPQFRQAKLRSLRTKAYTAREIQQRAKR